MSESDVFEPSAKSKLAYSSIMNRTAKMTLLEGAIRSSKSFTSDMASLHRISTLPACNVMLSGNTTASVARNVVGEWRKTLGSWRFKMNKEGRDEFMSINYKGLSDKKFYVVGGGKANDADKIKGITLGYWYADELTEQVKSFTDMAYSRLSLPYSQCVATTNPDNPFHYVKENYVDNQELINKGLLNVFSFDLDDNPSLTEEYKDSLKAQYKGVFYDRYILGKWVKAEGLVYPHFDPNRHIIPYEKIPNKMDELRVALDYGTQNACTFGFYGRIGKDWIKINEYYHSGRDSGKQKTNAQYKDDLITFFKENNIPLTTKVIVDPSAAGFKADLRQRRNQSDIEFKVNNASNKVAKGIQYLSTLIGNDNYYISDRCIETKKEYATYSWDAKKQKDEPIKENDHCMDADRYAVYTVFGSMK